MADLPFVDTNILLRHLRQDHADHSPRATALLMEVEGGTLRLRTLDTVVVETVFTLERTYRQPREAVRNALLPILELPGIVLPGKRWLRPVFDLYEQQSRLSFADCYHAIAMKRLGLTTMYSFDEDFDRVPRVRRQEPPPPPANAGAAE